MHAHRAVIALAFSVLLTGCFRTPPVVTRIDVTPIGWRVERCQLRPGFFSWSDWERVSCEDQFLASPAR